MIPLDISSTLFTEFAFDSGDRLLLEHIQTRREERYMHALNIRIIFHKGFMVLIADWDLLKNTALDMNIRLVIEYLQR